MDNYLINNIDDYAGKFVAVRDFGEKDVIAYGDIPDDVLENAAKAGATRPVIFYIEAKDVVQIY